MARGNIAKEEVTKVIADAFGDKFLGIADKKLYVQWEEGGEDIQIAISLTCPKAPVEFAAAPHTEPTSNTTPRSAAPAALSPVDEAKIQELAKKLGVTPS